MFCPADVPEAVVHRYFMGALVYRDADLSQNNFSKATDQIVGGLNSSRCAASEKSVPVHFEGLPDALWFASSMRRCITITGAEAFYENW